MNALHDHLMFFILWGVIFLAIVIVFPVTSIINHRMIKRTVEDLKKSYIDDLADETDRTINGIIVSATDKSVIKVMQSINANMIMSSKDYPINSVFTPVYVTLLSLFNFTASSLTVGQGVLTILNVL